MFKTMTSVLNKNSNPSDSEIKKIPSYIFCRWLSGNPHTIKAANSFNMYSDIPIENQYKMVKTAFAGKIRFIPYPKNTSQEDMKELQYIMQHFKINSEKAKDYIEVMDKEEFNNIIKMYKGVK